MYKQVVLYQITPKKTMELKIRNTHLIPYSINRHVLRKANNNLNTYLAILSS